VSILKIQNLSMSFGGILAVDDVSFEVRQGDVHALIGPNGAGKTTVLNCISRFYTPQSGAVVFQPARDASTNLLPLKAHQIGQLGIARTFQNLELFAELTVFDNVLMARSQAMKSNLFETLLSLPRFRRDESEQKHYTEQLLETLGLQTVAYSVVKDLPYGTQKMVELARAMALEPKLILLDEPATGMNAKEIEGLGSQLKKLQSLTGATLLLIEHSMPLVMRISDQITVMHNGRFLAQGTPAEIKKDSAVIEAYLGKNKNVTHTSAVNG